MMEWFMRQLLGAGSIDRSSELDDASIYSLYDRRGLSTNSRVRATFVASANGAIALAGRSAKITNSSDTKIFATLRTLADVVLVGAATARAENYRGARSSELVQRIRADREQERIPPIAVVSNAATLDPDSPLFGDTNVPPIIFVSAIAERERTTRLVDAGAEVLVAGDATVEISRVLEEMNRRSYRDILLEGGPQLFGTMIEADAVDELCLSLVPGLAGGTRFLTAGPEGPLHHMRLVSVLEDDGTLMLVYQKTDRSEG